jgi:hypothetical protein
VISALRQRAFLALGACALACGLAVASAPAATSSTVVSATVPSATFLANPTCLGAPTGATEFGVVLPGTTAVTGTDCTITFGSSNDTASLRAYQYDRAGSAMHTATDGDLHTAIGGGDGKVEIDGGDLADEIVRGAVARPDGGMMVVTRGPVGVSVRLMVLTPAGALDPGFGVLGVLDVPAASFPFSNASPVFAPDGSMWFVGNAGTGPTIGHLLSDGSPDVAFGPGGVQTFTNPWGQNILSIGGADVGADGSVYVAATLDRGGGLRDIAIFGVRPDGSVRAGFAPAVVDIAAEDGISGVAVHGDGVVFFAPEAWPGTLKAVARVDSTGALDGGWGVGGVRDISGFANLDSDALVDVDPAGNVFVSGRRYPGTGTTQFVVRVTAGGSIDMGYGTAGIVDIGDPNDNNYMGNDGLRALPDGTVLVSGVGQGHLGSMGGFGPLYVGRIDPDGVPDPTFDDDGIAYVDWGPMAWSRADAVVPLDDGRIAAVDHEDFGGPQSDVAIAYFEPGATVADYDPTVTDWDDGASTFGACLRLLGGGAGVDVTTWAVDPGNDCDDTDADEWNAIPKLTPTKIAHNGSSGSQVATASLRFGMRAATSQPAGVYQAAIVFETVAPG